MVIESAQLDHEGEYTCVATNKAGTLDIDVELTVLGMYILHGDILLSDADKRRDIDN